MASGPLGLLGSLLNFLDWAQGSGTLDVPIPVAAGLSGYAIGRGLLGGSTRAWRWACRIAVLGLAVVGIMVLMAVTSTGTVTVSLPVGSLEVGRMGAAVFSLLMGAFWVWQVAVLNSASVRARFAGPEPPADPEGSGP